MATLPLGDELKQRVDLSDAAAKMSDVRTNHLNVCKPQKNMSSLCDVSAFIRMAGLRQRAIPESHNGRTRIDKILNKRSQDEIVISRSTVWLLYKAI